MVVAATDYPLLDAFWTMVIFFVWVAWILLLFRVFADVFSRADLSGWGKAGWTLFVLAVPFLGVLIYLIAQGGAMTRRREAEAQAAQASFDSYVRSVANSNGQAATEISKAKELLDSGAISQDEYDALKSKALAS